MIRQCLLNRNKNTTVSKSKNFLDLNKVLLLHTHNALFEAWDWPVD